MRSMLRVLSALALVVALTVITGPSASAASARGAEAQSRASAGKGAGDVQLTYTKWFAPAYPTMQGVVGGDIEGTFGGAVLTRTVLPTVVLLEARYEIIASNPSHSFTAMIAGSLDRATGLAVLDGTVTAGWLTGKAVHVEFQTISCTQAPNGTCFTGTIRVIKASNPGNDENDD
ncbi:MAG: hypothetical protein E6H54_22330 [Betaproteobacteria bacterium]|nr:MAG: hypothetical protein E6H54_22330 [Betaproteobacteria bacterium]